VVCWLLGEKYGRSPRYAFGVGRYHRPPIDDFGFADDVCFGLLGDARTDIGKAWNSGNVCRLLMPCDSQGEKR